MNIGTLSGCRQVINESKEPLETIEVQHLAITHSGQEVSRPVLLYRLNNLRAEGEIQRKQVGSGKGTWIWWGESITSGAHTKVEKNERALCSVRVERPD